MVDLVRVQGDAAGEVDLHLVGRRQAPYQICTRAAAVLSHRQQRRDVVTRVAVLGRQERVVEVQLTDGDAVGPGRPLARHPLRGAEDTGAGSSRMTSGLRPLNGACVISSRTPVALVKPECLISQTHLPGSTSIGAFGKSARISDTAS